MAFFELGGTESDFPIRLFAVRPVAFAPPLLYGLIKRNGTVLATCYGMFVVLSLLDIGLLAFGRYAIPVIGDSSTVASVLLALFAFLAPMSVGFVYVVRHVGQREG